ncbi:hypothetical protein, variant 5 [Aphanomyces astaci]|uniref:CWH43-like N-terminal domain-containing protein n=1 Tax=Aphanomyces astaci TaxID=112090 RepID=W4FF99_APHAT|nr:hypothetical protein, variant 4 [Aphanomyces astaci]XP_009844372.1 hypothetical protein, variant 5 [Aphanomyces astaci]ETV66182.1 hypothetical protein, variant 4 [Aphanomyces astaci]ETV66183.1 hypothetical protein, variant 5 [Aphanomyces astaci]|eukprot:XP_009844370.1 hypothetical protein, variant 4 [Aphanomyces astaci]
MGSSADVLRRWSPILAPFFTVTTLIICIVITKTKDIYVGSLAWPYFSDMGRDDPAYYVFATGLCLTAIFLALTWTFNFRHQATVLAHPEAKATPSLLRCSFAASTMGAVATIGLPILVHNHPYTWYYYSLVFLLVHLPSIVRPPRDPQLRRVLFLRLPSCRRIPEYLRHTSHPSHIAHPQDLPYHMVSSPYYVSMI